MAVKKQVTTEEVLDQSQQVASDVDAEREEKEYRLEIADRDAIDKIILSNQVQNGGKVRIERKGPLDQAFQYICTMTAEQWTNVEEAYEYIRKMFGGGDYKCQTFRANGQMYKPFSFSIDYRYKGKLDDDEIKRMAADSANLKEQGQAAKLFDLIRTQNDGGIKMADIISLMKESSAKASDSTMCMMTLMMKSMEASQNNMTTMMAAILPIIAGNKSGSGTSEALLLKLIEQRQERTPMNETLEMMAKIKEIFEPGEKEPDDMWTKIAKIAAPMLGGMVQANQPQPPQGQIPSVSPNGQLPQGGLISMMPPQYSMLFELGMRAAQKGSDPSIYADLIVDQVDEHGFEMLRNILTPSDWCVKLFGDESAVVAVRPWLDELRLMILNYGTEDNNADAGSGEFPDTAESQRAGSSANPPDNRSGGRAGV